MSNNVGSTECVKIEFFGPFRKFAHEFELGIEDKITLNEVIEKLIASLGEDFEKRANSEFTTIVHNGTIIPFEEKNKLILKAGDILAFCLLIGGG